MAQFNQIIKLGHIKQQIRACLSEALKADSPRSDFARLFEGDLYIQSSQYLLHAIPFAAESEQNFNYWFEQVLDRACFDLFDTNGRVSSFFKKELGIKPLLDSLSAKFGAEALKRELLYAYCKQIIGGSLELPGIAADQYLGFRQRWDAKLQTLLRDDFSVTAKVASFSEFELGRLSQVWRWMEVSVKDIAHQSVNLCNTVGVLRRSIIHYFTCERQTQIGQDDIVAVTDLIAMRGVTLTREAIHELGSLIESFYQISRMSFDNSQYPQDIIDEINAYEDKLAIPELMCHQYATLVSLFYFSVNLDSISQEAKQDFILRSQHEVHPSALAHVRKLKDGSFESRFGVGSEDRLAQILAVINDYKMLANDSSVDLFRHYQAAIETRQLLLYCLKDQAGISPEFYPYVADAMELLQQIESRLNQFDQRIDKTYSGSQTDAYKWVPVRVSEPAAARCDLLTPLTLFSASDMSGELPAKPTSESCVSYILHGLYRFLCVMVEAIIAAFSVVVCCQPSERDTDIVEMNRPVNPSPLLIM